MGYTWKGMQKISWKEIQEIHQSVGLTGFLKLYNDESESTIDSDYTWAEIVEHHETGGGFGKER